MVQGHRVGRKSGPGFGRKGIGLWRRAGVSDTAGPVRMEATFALRVHRGRSHGLAVVQRLHRDDQGHQPRRPATTYEGLTRPARCRMRALA